MQFANVGAVEQTAAAPALVCSSKPLLHECVASTAPVDAYERSTLSKETIPFASDAIESHFAAEHVGAALDGSHVPELHISVGAPTSVYPFVHVNVSTVSGAPALALSAVPVIVLTPFVCAAGAPAHVIAVHVGVVVLDQAPAAPHETTSATPDARS